VRADSRTRSRVGIIVFASLILFMGAVMVVGGKTGFFIRRTSYFARFPNSLGVITGNQVRLAGVAVGAVREIEVPKKPGQDLTIHFDIERKYQHLVKTDSRVEIKTIGLLGDKYLEVTPGSPDKPDLEPDHEIMAYQGAELDKILAGSGDLVDNVVAISKSLKNILGRTEKGEGLLGELTSSSPAGEALSKSLRQTVEAANLLLRDVRSGSGVVGRLLQDKGLADKVAGDLTSATGSLNRIMKSVEQGQGLVPSLLTDAEGRKKFFAMVDSLKATADGLNSFSSDLTKGGGLLPQLLKDDAFAKSFTGDLKKLSEHLANVATKLDSTDGTVGKLIADTSVHDAIDDVLVGINESKTLRWLIRNRQRSGIQKRYDAEHAAEKSKAAGAQKPKAAPPEPPPAPTPTPPPG
jgi:phospholipid/cholesterol/gamma-HCH transport system substrate-binding protein